MILFNNNNYPNVRISKMLAWALGFGGRSSLKPASILTYNKIKY